MGCQPVTFGSLPNATENARYAPLALNARQQVPIRQQAVMLFLY